MIDYAKPAPRAATLVERLRAAGISAERAQAAITQGRVRVGEDIVTDPDHPTPWPAAWVVLPSS